MGAFGLQLLCGGSTEAEAEVGIDVIVPQAGGAFYKYAAAFGPPGGRVLGERGGAHAGGGAVAAGGDGDAGGRGSGRR